MASAMDITTLKRVISALLCQQSGPVTEQEIRWITGALGYICSNYSSSELPDIILRTALEKGDRQVQGHRLDS